MKLEVTKSQLEAIVNLADDISAMIGNDYDVAKIWRKNVRLVDRMLKKNGLKRRFN